MRVLHMPAAHLHNQSPSTPAHDPEQLLGCLAVQRVALAATRARSDRAAAVGAVAVTVAWLLVREPRGSLAGDEPRHGLARESRGDFALLRLVAHVANAADAAAEAAAAHAAAGWWE
eukprot:1520419-Rhodomonas_salina.1